MKCSTVIHKDVCVEAEVKVAPNVKTGDVKSHCVGEPELEKIDDCSYMVNQMVCVRFPLSFSAGAHVKRAGIACDKPCPFLPMPCCNHTQNRKPFFFPLLLALALLCKS